MSVAKLFAANDLDVIHLNGIYLEKVKDESLDREPSAGSKFTGISNIFPPALITSLGALNLTTLIAVDSLCTS